MLAMAMVMPGVLAVMDGKKVRLHLDNVTASIERQERVEQVDRTGSTALCFCSAPSSLVSAAWHEWDRPLGVLARAESGQ